MAQYIDENLGTTGIWNREEQEKKVSRAQYVLVPMHDLEDSATHTILVVEKRVEEDSQEAEPSASYQ